MTTNIKFVLDHCNSFSQMELQNIKQNTFYLKSKNVEQQNTRISISNQKEVKKNSHRKFITPRKEHHKQIKKELKYFPVFRQLEKQKQLKNQSKIQQTTVIRISKRIKKKYVYIKYYLALFQPSNLSSKIKICNKNIKKITETEINNFQRIKIYDWLMDVCQVLEFSRQTFHKCLNLFQKLRNTQKKFAQLTATTCLFMIAKLEQNTHQIEIFSHITQQSCKINEIKVRELQILIELKFKINSHSIFSQMYNILTLWDEYLTKNPSIIQFTVSKFKILGKNFTAIKNFLQLCIFIDYFRIHKILPDRHEILIICGIFIIAALDIGQLTFDQIEFNKSIKFAMYTLTNILISGFLKEYFNELSINSIYRFLNLIGPKASILKVAPQIYQKVTTQLEQNKFEIYKQLHFNGLV